MFNDFKKLVEDSGCEVFPVAAMINGYWTTRPDVVSVRYNGFHVMTSPSNIYDHKIERHRTLEGIEQPSFYELEHQFLSIMFMIQRSPFLVEREAKEREVIAKTKLCES